MGYRCRDCEWIGQHAHDCRLEADKIYELELRGVDVVSLPVTADDE